MAKVFISVPTLGGKIHINLMAHLIAWSKAGAQVNAMVGVSPVEHARNEAVRAFLMGNYDYLFFVDDDTVPPIDAIKKLMEADKDIVSGITPIMRRNDQGEMETSWNCFLKREDDIEKGITTLETVDKNTGLQEVISCGGSCLLIKRDAFLKIGSPWFFVEWNKDHTGYVGEDLSFCKKAREAGYKIWADTSVICQHAKEILI
jgi:GT2 family glycosyltransferase